jgi:hypothetical protein
MEEAEGREGLKGKGGGGPGDVAGRHAETHRVGSVGTGEVVQPILPPGCGMENGTPCPTRLILSFFYPTERRRPSSRSASAVVATS